MRWQFLVYEHPQNARTLEVETFPLTIYLDLKNLAKGSDHQHSTEHCNSPNPPMQAIKECECKQEENKTDG